MKSFIILSLLLALFAPSGLLALKADTQLVLPDNDLNLGALQSTGSFLFAAVDTWTTGGPHSILYLIQNMQIIDSLELSTCSSSLIELSDVSVLLVCEPVTSGCDPIIIYEIEVVNQNALSISRNLTIQNGPLYCYLTAIISPQLSDDIVWFGGNGESIKNNIYKFDLKSFRMDVSVTRLIPEEQSFMNGAVLADGKHFLVATGSDDWSLIKYTTSSWKKVSSVTSDTSSYFPVVLNEKNDGCVAVYRNNIVQVRNWNFDDFAPYGDVIHINNTGYFSGGIDIAVAPSDLFIRGYYNPNADQSINRLSIEDAKVTGLVSQTITEQGKCLTADSAFFFYGIGNVIYRQEYASSSPSDQTIIIQ